jgi:hypothetical protein
MKNLNMSKKNWEGVVNFPPGTTPSTLGEAIPPWLGVTYHLNVK